MTNPADRHDSDTSGKPRADAVRGSTVDLRRDGEAILRGQWLQPGERLIAHVPVWRLPYLEGIPKPRRTGEQIRAALVRGLLGWPKYLLIGVFMIFMAEGITPGGERKGPPVMIKGPGPGSDAGRIVGPALRGRGLWALSDRRLAFVVIRGRTYAQLFSSDPQRGSTDEPHRPVPIETVFAVTADRFRREGKVESVKGTKPVGTYERIVLADGSSVELRCRLQRN